MPTLIKIPTPDLRQHYLQQLKQNPAQLNRLSAAIQNDPNFLLDAIENNYNVWPFIALQIKKTPNFYFEAIEINSNVLKYFPAEFKHSPDHMYEAVKRNGAALRYASDEVKSNVKIIQEANDQNPQSFLLASPSIRKDKALVLHLLVRRSNIYPYIPEELKEDPHFIIKALELNGDI